MTALTFAHLTVTLVPLGRWRNMLGASTEADPDDRARRARQLAGAVDRAADRLPFTTKCLPRAVALSWLLRRRGMHHALVIAVRPPHLRDAPDALHAWVEIGGAKIIGDLPGPWIETLRLGHS